MTKKIKLKKYGDTIWHPESRLVFKSRKDKCVVGRLNEKEDLVVDDKMLELSDQWNFKVDPDIVESAEESAEEEKVNTSQPGSETPKSTKSKSKSKGKGKECMALVPTSLEKKSSQIPDCPWMKAMLAGNEWMRDLNRLYEQQVQVNEKLEMELKCAREENAKLAGEKKAVEDKMKAIKSLFS